MENMVQPWWGVTQLRHPWPWQDYSSLDKVDNIIQANKLNLKCLFTFLRRGDLRGCDSFCLIGSSRIAKVRKCWAKNVMDFPKIIISLPLKYSRPTESIGQGVLSYVIIIRS